MSDQDTKIRQDALNFINNLDKMPHRERVAKLIELLREHADMGTKDVILDYSDLLSIVGEANKLWVNSSTPMEISKSSKDLGHNYVVLNYNEYNQLCLIKSAISVLNKKECFKKIPRFNEK